MQIQLHDRAPALDVERSAPLYYAPAVSLQLAPKARASARAAGFAALTVAMLGGVELHQRLSRPSARPDVFDRHMRLWCRTLLRLFQVEARVEPAIAPPKAAHGRLVVSNHRSPIDIAILLSIFGGQVLSRADLASWPVLGTAARKAGTIFVNRGEGTSGASAIRAIRHHLRDGNTVIVYPEGTTFAGDEIRPFRMGAFVGLHQINVEIVPVALAYEPGTEFVDESFMQHLQRVAARRRTRVGVRIGEPFAASVHAAATGNQAREQVQKLVVQARTLCDQLLQK